MQRSTIVVAHNGYQHRGGEDSVAESEIALLRDNGHTVVEYRRHNDELADGRTGRLQAAVLEKAVPREFQKREAALPGQARLGKF